MRLLERIEQGDATVKDAFLVRLWIIASFALGFSVGIVFSWIF